MQRPPAFQKRTALLLVLLFAAAWLLRTVHGVVLHHQHAHNRLACTAFHDEHPGKTHLHDMRYAVEDCPVCDFGFAVPELISITALLSSPAPRHDSVTVFFQEAEENSLKDTVFRRGPPCLRNKI